MKIAQTARHVIAGVYWLSPYAWADHYLKACERRCEPDSEAQQALRTRRLVLSERYIGYWFFAAAALFLFSAQLPAWLAALLHAAQVHFSLASTYVAADLRTALLGAFHSAYCFLYGTLVISLFVSLLSVRPLRA